MDRKSYRQAPGEFRRKIEMGGENHHCSGELAVGKCPMAGFPGDSENVNAQVLKPMKIRRRR